MGHFEEKKGQGATEYLLMLAAVLVVVAAAVYYVTSSTPSFTITPATGYPQTSSSDNSVAMFVANQVTPENLGDATVRVIKPDGTQIGTNTVSITSGKTVTVSCSEAIPANSELRITYEGSTKNFTIQT